MCDKETLILYTRQRQKTHSVPDMKIVTGVGGVWVCVWVCVCVLITQLCLTLCDLPGSAVHGILQARILSGLPFPSQGIFRTQGSNLVHLCLLHRQASSLLVEPPGKPGVLCAPVTFIATRSTDSTFLEGKLASESYKRELRGGFLFFFQFINHIKKSERGHGTVSSAVVPP